MGRIERGECAGHRSFGTTKPWGRLPKVNFGTALEIEIRVTDKRMRLGYNVHGSELSSLRVCDLLWEVFGHGFVPSGLPTPTQCR